MTSRTSICVALLVALATGAARAGVTASLALSDFKVRLVDLDLADGFSPSIDFYGGDVTIFIVNATLNNEPPEYVYRHSDAMFGAGSAAVADGSRSSATSLVGDPLAGTATLTATALDSGANGYAQANLSFGYPNPYGTFDTVYFNLTPMTRLEISASAAGSVAVDGGGGFGRSQFWLDLGLPDGGPSTGYIQLRAEAGLPGTPMYDSFNTIAALAFENASANAAIGRFTGHLIASASGPSAPVPEPAVFALMGAGLMAIAAARYRRR